MFEEFVKNNPAKFKFKYTPSEQRTIELFFIMVRLKEGNNDSKKSYKAIIQEVHDEYMREYNERNGIEATSKIKSEADKPVDKKQKQ